MRNGLYYFDLNEYFFSTLLLPVYLEEVFGLLSVQSSLSYDPIILSTNSSSVSPRQRLQIAVSLFLQTGVSDQWGSIKVLSFPHFLSPLLDCASSSLQFQEKMAVFLTLYRSFRGAFLSRMNHEQFSSLWSGLIGSSVTGRGPSDLRRAIVESANGLKSDFCFVAASNTPSWCLYLLLRAMLALFQLGVI